MTCESRGARLGTHRVREWVRDGTPALAAPASPRFDFKR
jgi:hypothetical protein